MASHTRSRFVAAIAREVADILEFEVKDPVVCGATPTVVRVRSSPNGEQVIVTVAVDGTPEGQKTVLSAQGYDGPLIRSQLARRVSARRVPGLRFVLAGQVRHGAEEGGSGGT